MNTKLLFLFATVLIINAEDYYKDEKGNIYTIGQWGQRRYSGDSYDMLEKSQVDNNGIMKFGWKLFQSVKGDNFVVSPLSPQIILSYLKKETKGKTNMEIVEAIGNYSTQDLEKLMNQMLNEPTTRELKIKTAVFMPEEPQVKESFLKNDKGSEKQVEVVTCDFRNTEAVKRRYGKWVNDATKGNLKDFKIDIDQDTKMLITSAIYFKGQWLFDFTSTQQSEFVNLHGEKFFVDSMNVKKKFHSGTFSNLAASWAEIPYNSTESMIIILPNKDVPIDDIIGNMKHQDLKEIIDVVTGYPTSNTVNITMPKFKLETLTSLKDPLEKMGIKELFSTQSQLYLYDNDIPLQVSDALQQTSLEVNEKGSIGASATAFSAVALTIQRDTEDTDFVVNRPFISIIFDRKYSVPYFMAKITDPRL